MLQKTFIAVLNVVLLSTLAFGLRQDAPWQRFTSPEEEFTVLLPSAPKRQVNDIEGTMGKSTLYSYSSGNRIGLFSVLYFDHPVESKDAVQQESRLDVVSNGILKNLSGEVIAEKKKIQLYGYPGREFTVKKIEQGSEDIYQWKIFLVGRRVYQLTVATERKDSASPDIAKFFTSFALNN